jgi:hypothetical protein
MKRLLLLIAAALASGGALAQTEIDANESGAIIPSFRLGFRIASEAGPEGPSTPHNGHGIEVGLAGGSGSDDQSLAAGQRVVVGGRTFTGATNLEHEYDFRLFEIAYRYRRFFGQTSTFGIEALGGVGFAELDFSTRSPAFTANDKMSSGGFVGGFGLIWKVQPAVTVQSRLSLFLSGETEGVTAAGRFDAHVVWAFARNVAVRAGAASWVFESLRAEDEDASSPNSRLRTTTFGLSLGLDVAF